MIVDRERKVIYLHNPKCGGTFLRNIYIEKYGKTEATKWWKLFSKEYGTDLGHITYDDLPRFITEWEDYRIVTMIRNPYNRFYSGIKELKKQLAPFNFCSIKNFRYFYEKEWLSLNKYQKIYELLRSICPGTYTGLLVKLNLASPEDACKYISSLKRSKQDVFLRNKRIPWIAPQSNYMADKVEILRYESESDWEKLLETFGLSAYKDRLAIAKDYAIPDDIRKKIEKLYQEDRELFLMYSDSIKTN